MGDPGIGLCHGTLRAVDAVALVELAGANGMSAVMLPPFPKAGAGELGGFRARLGASGVRRVVLDGVMAALPRCAFATQMGWTVDQHFAVAERFAVDCFNVPHYRGDPETPLTELVDALGPFSERARAMDITVALEFLPATGIPDLARARRIVESIGLPNVGIALDTWHMARTHTPLDALVALPKGMLKAFQISDRAADQDAKPDSEQWGRLLPGEGALPLVEIVRAVRENAPELTLDAEIFSETLQARPPADVARDVAQSLRRLVARL